MPTLARMLCLLLVLCAALGLYVYEARATRAAIAACEGSHACYQGLLFDRVEKFGLNRGWETLEHIYAHDPAFRALCHSFALQAAQEAYARYPDHAALDLGASLALCNYGFLQEYPQELVLQTKDAAKAQSFCLAVAAALGSFVPGAEAECWRGVGRGLPLIEDPRTKEEVAAAAERAVGACDRLAPNQIDKQTCYSGVFNILGRTAVAAGAVDMDDPLWLCNQQTGSEARNRCFGNFKAAAVSLVDIDDTAAAGEHLLRLYKTEATSSIAAAMWTIGYERARSKLVGNPVFEEEIAACAALPGLFVRDCIRGASVGIAKHGAPWRQHVLLSAFCAAARAALPQLAPDDCPSSQALGFIRGLHAPREFAGIYKEMKRSLGAVVEEEQTRGFGYEAGK